MRRWILGPASLLLIAGTTVVIGSGPAQAATTITINGSAAGRVFDGIGAVSGGGGNSRLLIDYPEPQRTQILDYLFRPNYGAAMQILKVEIGGDTYSTSGAEPSHKHTAADLNCNRGYEWWLMEQAKARNPAIKLAGLSWGAPGWIGNGNFWSTDMINYLIAWLNCAGQHGLTIDYLGGWNERGRDLNWYVNLNNALDANGFSNVRIVASDDSNGWSVADDAVNNTAFRNAVDVLGVHYVCGYRSAQTTCPSSTNALNTGKVLWASENGSDDYNAGAPALARGINRDYIDGRMTAYINWPVIAAVYPNLPFPTMGVALAPQPWSGYYSIGKNAWVMAHTTQFTASGWRYLDSASGFLSGNRNIGSYVTLRAPTGNQWSTVVETTGATAAEPFTFTVTGGLATGAVRVWSTNLNSSNPAEFLVRGSDLNPTSGSTYTINLQPGRLYTLTTTTGGGKGTASSNTQAVLALPYADNFDGYGLGAEARYLSDVQGSYEVSACGGGRGGRCVRQVAPRAPITWSTLSDAYTIIGDVNWQTYTVSVDALLESAGYVELLGRVGTQAAFNPPGLNSYRLRVANTGAWSIRRLNTSAQVTTLASGTRASLGTNTWHTLSLSFSGSTITARIDGAVVGTVNDTMFGAGMVGVAQGWNYLTQIDNLSITGTTPPPPPPAGPVRHVASNRCLDVNGASQTNGARTIIWDCHAGTNQQWAVTGSGELRVYGSKCLDVLNQATTSGSAVGIWDCNGGTNQRWTFNANGTVVGAQSGLCLTPTGNGTANGTQTVIATCTGAAAQQWTRQ